MFPTPPVTEQELFGILLPLSLTMGSFLQIPFYDNGSQRVDPDPQQQQQQHLGICQKCEFLGFTPDQLNQPLCTCVWCRGCGEGVAGGKRRRGRRRRDSNLYCFFTSHPSSADAHYSLKTTVRWHQQSAEHPLGSNLQNCLSDKPLCFLEGRYKLLAASVPSSVW